MTVSPAARVLFDVYKQRVTGTLKVSARGRTSRLLIAEGDLVGTDIRFGHRTATQALLGTGQLSPRMLDALWARGFGGVPDEDALEELGLDAGAVDAARLLATVRHMVAISDDVAFEPGEVAGEVEGHVRVNGARAVRAAFEAVVDEADEVFRCAEPEACAPWVESDEELALLGRLTEFAAPGQIDAHQRALLRVLELDGKVEALSAEAWQEREAARLAAAQEAAEEARLPEEARIAAEEPSSEDSRSADAPSETDAAPQSAPAATDAPHIPPMLLESWGDAFDRDALEAARRRAQEDLAREMNEALARAGAAPMDDWLQEEPAPVPELDVEEVAFTAEPEASADPQPVLLPEELGASAVSPDTELWVAGQPASMQPLILGGPGATPSSGDDDLWRIVAFDQNPASADDMEPGSFEEALRRVDENLERLVGLAQAPDPGSAIAGAAELLDQVPVEAEVLTVEPSWTDQASVPSPEPGDKPGASGETPADFDDDWPLDEDDLVGDPSDAAEAARLRRQRLLRRAMENMGTLPRPGTGAVNVEPVPQSTAAPSAQTPGPAPSAPATLDEQQLARTIEEKFASLAQRRNHFTVLGIPTHATRDQVKAAFLSQAKVFHPDRLPPSLGHLSSKMTALFEAIREAYETLYDDNRRREYLLSLQQPVVGAAPAASSHGAVEQAAEAYKKGELFFRKRDFLSAEEHYSRAYQLDPKAEYLAARGWALYMDPARRAEAQRAKQMMVDALKVNPSCDRAHYQLGVIARVENRPAEAERHFREAVRANPRHLEANQELRLIEMRKKRESGRKGGLFG